MRKWLMSAVLGVLILTESVHAATLVWDAQTIASPLTVEKSATATGTFAPVATLPTGVTSYVLTPGAYGWYRVRYSGIANSVPSNVVQFSADLFTGPVTLRLDALEAHDSTQTAALSALTARVVTLENEAIRVDPIAPPAPYTPVTCYDNLIPGDHIVCTQQAVGGSVPMPPTPLSNLTMRQIDTDHIEIVGTNCLNLKTTGTGLRRTVECVH